MLDNSPSTNINLFSLSNDEKERMVSQAINRLQSCCFSITDLYREIGFSPGKGNWNFKEQLFPRVLIYRVFRERGVHSRDTRNAKISTPKYFIPDGMRLNCVEV